LSFEERKRNRIRFPVHDSVNVGKMLISKGMLDFYQLS